jgi:hypothetical protein
MLQWLLGIVRQMPRRPKLWVVAIGSAALEGALSFCQTCIDGGCAADVRLIALDHNEASPGKVRRRVKGLLPWKRVEVLFPTYVPKSGIGSNPDNWVAPRHYIRILADHSRILARLAQLLGRWGRPPIVLWFVSCSGGNVKAGARLAMEIRSRWPDILALMIAFHHADPELQQLAQAANVNEPSGRLSKVYRQSSSTSRTPSHLDPLKRGGL